MSKQELERVEVVALRRAGRITQAEAGRRLGVSERQVRRLEAKVAARGAAGLRSAQRGRPSNHRLPERVVSQVGAVIRAHYRDFGPTLASEYLAEQHGISLSKETVRTIMIKAKLWRPQRGPVARLHRLRDRRPCFGELIQVDGSTHDWFEGRAAHCCLLVFIDDATSRLTQLLFVAKECTLGYMQALHGHIRTHGLPMALYSDRHSIFRVNTGEARDDGVTQLGRALAALGIESICANSPQAKGRVERANATLQDRLIKAMRIVNIDSMEQANAWLPGFVQKHNARFAVAPFGDDDAHVLYRGEDRALKRTLSRQYPRTLSKDLTCQFQSTFLQVNLPSSGASYRGAAVTIVEHFDGTYEMLHGNALLPHSRMNKPRKAPIEAGRAEVLAGTPDCSHKPARKHPWFNSPIGKLSPEFSVRS